MDEIRAILETAIRRFRYSGQTREELVEDILQRLEPYLKGPKIPVKQLSDLAGWLK